ncbi:MAG: M48 family metallopeptidase [Cytophagales bacterium]|nr:M48 family metallopeptidase [Armatimonadota bacterium]
MGGNRGRGGAGLLVALLMAAFALFRYYGSSQVNTVTGEKQRVAGISAQQEIALGLQAAPQMQQRHGGPSQNAQARALVAAVGEKIARGSDAAKTPYQYNFTLLDDDKTVNAFALPGGQIFMTDALASRFKTEGQFAGVLAHEAGHVIARHGAEHIAKQQLTQGLTGAAVLATYDPNNPSTQRSAAVLAAIGQLVNLKYGREDELEADRLGVRLMAQAGYDPRSLIQVMEVLKASGGGGRQPEFFSSHPNPENRIQRIQEAIKKEFPGGVPAGLKP